MFYDIFLISEPAGTVIETRTGADTKAALISLMEKEQAHKPSVGYAAELARIQALKFDDTVIKRYDGLEAVSKQKRRGQAGYFWHCLCDSKLLPADPVFFSDAPAYMKTVKGEPLHTFGGIIREPEQNGAEQPGD